jgi:hypothetical protein
VEEAIPIRFSELIAFHHSPCFAVVLGNSAVGRWFHLFHQLTSLTCFTFSFTHRSVVPRHWVIADADQSRHPHSKDWFAALKAK